LENKESVRKIEIPWQELDKEKVNGATLNMVFKRIYRKSG